MNKKILFQCNLFIIKSNDVFFHLYFSLFLKILSLGASIVLAVADTKFISFSLNLL